MELRKDRVGDPVLPICKESVKNSLPTLQNYGEAELCFGLGASNRGLFAYL